VSTPFSALGPAAQELWHARILRRVEVWAAGVLIEWLDQQAEAY
jgi:hypothetical protein